MMKSMKEKMKNRKGFTLVELVVVIAILGILAAIAIPKLSQTRANAANGAHNANVRTLESAATMLIAEKGVPAAKITWGEGASADASADVPANGTGRGWGPYLQKWPEVPGGANVSEIVYEVKIETNGNIVVSPAAVTQ